MKITDEDIMTACAAFDAVVGPSPNRSAPESDWARIEAALRSFAPRVIEKLATEAENYVDTDLGICEGDCWGHGPLEDWLRSFK